jgi:hypothetical protein
MKGLASMGFFLTALEREDHRRMRELQGATVMKIDCWGCMATDHRFVWIGNVTGFAEQKSDKSLAPGLRVGPIALVQVVKREGDHRDIRDADLGIEHVLVRDTCLQRLAPNLFIVYK